LLPLDLTVEDVHGDLQEGRAGNPRHRMANGQLDVLGNSVGLIHHVGELGDGAHHADVIHLLERTLPQTVEGPLATEDQNRRVGAPGVGHAGHAVGDAGAGRDRRHADLARIAARPGIRRVHSGLLVTHVDHLDAFVQAAVDDGHDVATGEHEDDLYTSLFEGASRELSTVNGHGGLLSA